MLDILEKIVAGNGEMSDLEVLEQLADTITATALCGLGKTAANPVVSTLKYFRDEYKSHRLVIIILPAYSIYIHTNILICRENT